MQNYAQNVSDPRQPLQNEDVDTRFSVIDAGNNGWSGNKKLFAIGSILLIALVMFSRSVAQSKHGASEADKIDISNIDDSNLEKELQAEKVEHGFWDPISFLPLAYGPSQEASDNKKTLFVENMQDRDEIHLGKPEEGYVKINTHNDRVKKRRRDMAAFDKIRVEYCGTIFDDDSVDSIEGSQNGKQNHWKRSGQVEGSTTLNAMSSKLGVVYAKNSIDYSIAYNARRPSSHEARKILTEKQLEQLRDVENEIDHLVDNYRAASYDAKRYICERTWGDDAPHEEYKDATVTIERLGPFYSHGNYDWNSVRSVSDAADLLKQFSKSIPEEMYVLGTFFQPTFRNGTLISYPPLHVHHTHIHPYSGKEMGNKIKIMNDDLLALVEKFKTEEGVNEIFDKLFDPDLSAYHNETIRGAFRKEFDKRLKNYNSPEFQKDLERILKGTPENFVNHHVILQGHGDAECKSEQGGPDCVLHLLDPGNGYKVFDSSGFNGNFEINDVRNTKQDFDVYFEKYFDLQQLLDGYKMQKKEALEEKAEEEIDQTHADDNVPQHGRRLTRLEYDQYVDEVKQNRIEYYIDTAIIWTKKPKVETTFLQFGNPPMGYAWMTYMFPLDAHTNFMFYNYTNYFLGPGEFSNFILHSHMSYVDSIYVFKGDHVHSTLLQYVEERNGMIPFIFECHDENLSNEKKDEILERIQKAGGDLVCEGTKPSLVLYCDKEDDESCIYRDRRIDFNCLEKIRLEAFETLTIVAFNRVRAISTNGKFKRVEKIPDLSSKQASDFQTNSLRHDINNAKSVPNQMNLNNLAITSSFGYSFAAHQHSFFRGDFVSDKAKKREYTRSFGNAVADFALGNYAPPAYFHYGYWEQLLWDNDQQQNMMATCKADVSYEGFLPWENFFSTIDYRHMN